MAHPKGSRDRAAAMQKRAGVRVCGPRGDWFEPSLRDIQRKVSKAETHGLRGLMRKRREAKPESRLILTKRWDAATAGLDHVLRAEIARKVRQRIRDLWGGGAAYSAVQRLAGEHLADLTLKAGIGGSFAEIMPACELPKGVVEAGRSARRVHQHRTDIKAWDDQRPRVRLTSAGLAPMEFVFGDVHHFDVYVTRPDGTLATPKGIAWLDAATRRVRIDLVLCEPGTAIRNSDVIDSFIHMTQDPHWGMPAKLYLDNVLRSEEGRLARQQVSVREHAPAVCLSSTSIQAAPADPEELSAIANTGSSRRASELSRILGDGGGQAAR